MKNLSVMAQAVRLLAIDMVEYARSGHPGMPLGMADVATALWAQTLKFDASCPEWPDRDRVVLSAGHGAALLYAIGHLVGYEALPLAELQRFRQAGSRTPGHPEHDVAIGIEATTGPLGQGLAQAVGMALAEARLRNEFGSDLVDHRTYALVGDGCLMEGISHEAADLAGHLVLNRLTVLWDDNGITIDGPRNLSTSENTMLRFESYGWNVQDVDGLNPEALIQVLQRTHHSTRPTFIRCRTVIGHGSPKAGNCAVHGSPLGLVDHAATRQALGYPPHGPLFQLAHDPQILNLQTTGLTEVELLWREVGRRHHPERLAWEARAAAVPAFDRRQKGALAQGLADVYRQRHHLFVSDDRALATRQFSQAVIEDIRAVMPELMGGAADLSLSNGTKGANAIVFDAQERGGDYVHYGVREHAMVAVMNGMALHKGLIPYGGTFLCFTDYARPAIRLAALMQQRVIIVATHDSIGLGEDGPTHQPVEHLAALRAIPRLRVFRPADGPEVLAAWALALAHKGPSVLALTRQPVEKCPRPEQTWEAFYDQCARGAYVLWSREAHSDDTECVMMASHVIQGLSASQAQTADDEKTHNLGESDAKVSSSEPQKGRTGPKLDLWATGSEVGLALRVARTWSKHYPDCPVRVISALCLELLDSQPWEYRQSLRPQGPTLVAAIEAAHPYGWAKYVGADGLVMGVKDFGQSAAAHHIYEAQGLTEQLIREQLEKRWPIIMGQDQT